jgi:hypothetical protein
MLAKRNSPPDSPSLCSNAREPDVKRNPRAQRPQRWVRQPADGSNVLYWYAAGGWIIEAPRRFRPVRPYTLFVPGVEEGVPDRLACHTLADAKRAAKLPRPALIKRIAAEHAERQAWRDQLRGRRARG